MHRKKMWVLTAIIPALALLFFVFGSPYLAAKPTVETASAKVTGTSVTINGLFKDGKKPSQYGFQWGSNTKLGESVKLGSKIQANTKFSAKIDGLQAGSTYYYQAYAANQKGSGYGKLKSFTVPAPKNAAPEVTFTSPADHLLVTAGEIVKINATARDDHQVKEMSLSINAVSKTKVNGNHLDYDWNTEGIAAGDYSLVLSAWDGSKTGSKSLLLTVKAAEELNASNTEPSLIQGNRNLNSSSTVSRGESSSNYAKYPKLSKVNGIFGQFHYRELSDGRIEVDPQWVANNIVTITLPGLNRQVQVHKDAADNFIRAFNYIKNGTAVINGRQVSLLSLVYTMDGTYVARHVNWDPSRGLSNHSWGTAIDINADGHFGYVDSATDPNMILWEKAFQPAGFSWGNRYSDSMHYELLK